MISDITVVLLSVGLAVVGFIAVIVVCAVILRLLEVVMPTDSPSSEPPDEPPAAGDAG